MKRCSWVNLANPLYKDYHDNEWGRPLFDDGRLFEALCMEIYQAGLSWEIVLNKRDHFRQAFHHYAINEVAQMTDDELDALLTNPAIIRHRKKLYATRQNARAVLKLQMQFGSFASYLWSFVDGQTQVHAVSNYDQLPSETVLAKQLANALKKAGFTFLGPIVVQSFLQAVGLVDDHENTCAFKNNH